MWFKQCYNASCSVILLTFFAVHFFDKFCVNLYAAEICWFDIRRLELQFLVAEATHLKISSARVQTERVGLCAVRYRTKRYRGEGYGEVRVKGNKEQSV